MSLRLSTSAVSLRHRFLSLHLVSLNLSSKLLRRDQDASVCAKTWGLDFKIRCYLCPSMDTSSTQCWCGQYPVELNPWYYNHTRTFRQPLQIKTMEIIQCRAYQNSKVTDNKSANLLQIKYVAVQPIHINLELYTTWYTARSYPALSHNRGNRKDQRSWYNNLMRPAGANSIKN